MAPVMRFVVAGWHVAVSMHALCVVLAVLAAALVAVRRARAPGVVLAWLPVLVAATLAGSHALYWGTHGGALAPVSGGMASMGGVAALAVALCAAARGSGRRFADLADAIAPAALVGLAIGRVGCFLAGCCAGHPADLPWSVVFPELGPAARHPLQLYSAVVDVALARAVARIDAPPGAAAAWSAIGLGAVRLALESFRDPAAADTLAGGLGSARVGAAVLVAGGLTALLRVRGRRARPR